MHFKKVPALPFYSFLSILLLLAATAANAQPTPGSSAEAEAIVKRTIAVLGGDEYLKVTSQIGKGKFSVVREGAVVSFQSFTDIIVFPDKERTDFKGSES